MNVRFFQMLHRKDVREIDTKNLEERAGSLIEELKSAECKTEHDLRKLRRILNWIDLEYVEELGKSIKDYTDSSTDLSIQQRSMLSI